jgi:hypothetical protein
MNMPIYLSYYSTQCETKTQVYTLCTPKGESSNKLRSTIYKWKKKWSLKRPGVNDLHYADSTRLVSTKGIQS